MNPLISSTTLSTWLTIHFRDTQTRGKGCLFSVITLQISLIEWELKYRPGDQYNIYNHKPSQNPSQHYSHRQLKGLFITCPDSIQLLQHHHDVLLIDNTYKTNQFELSLMDIIGWFTLANN